MQLGPVDEDEEVSEVTDRAYWETRGSKKTVAIADEILAIAKAHDPALELKYNKFYIGLAKHGQACNFVIFRPTKGFIRFEPRIASTNAVEGFFGSAGLDVMEYDTRWGRYRIRLQPGDVEKNRKIVESVVALAYEQSCAE
jgi:hypothetical protein